MGLFLKILIVIVTVVVLFLAQNSFLAALPFVIFFDLTFLFVFLLNFLKPGRLGFFAAFLAGLLLDSAGGFSFGVFILSFIFLAWLTQFFSNTLQRSNIVVFFAVFIIAYLFWQIAPLVLQSLAILIFEKTMELSWPVSFLSAGLRFLANLILGALGFLAFSQRNSYQILRI